MQVTLEAVDAMDRFNALLQAEIEITQDSLPVVALELAQIKLRVNQWFYQRRLTDGVPALT